jgi:tRNA pseudouridine32 synthase/23S rRNA pseudouridine746 synthase
MRRRQKPPLGKRHGLDPARLRLPEQAGWVTIRDHLVERLPRVPAERIDQLLAEGGIVDLDGPIGPDAPYVPGGSVWFHRDLPAETEVPFEITIVHRDDDLLVVDKPHFLSTIPRGQHILQTALVRLRRDLELPELIPAHRLDRATAGLVLFVINPARRGAYQTMFQQRRVHKTYEAIARFDPELELPRTVRSRIVKERHIIRAFETEGEPNAETRVELLEQRDGLGRYRLVPHTGRTHQLRLHMNSLGIPILGDDFYPELTEKPVDDFTRPLQLLAVALAFTDPVTRAQRRFETTRTLQAWTDPPAWDGRSGHVPAAIPTSHRFPGNRR